MYRRRISFLPRMHGRLGVGSAPMQQRRRHTEPLNTIQDRGEQLPRHRNFGRLKRHLLGVPNHLSSDLDPLLPERRLRPVFHGPQ